MPKKFAGENSKAVAARQRKENTKQEKEQKMKKMIEDSEWEDNDEKLKKKQQKKVCFYWLYNYNLSTEVGCWLKCRYYVSRATLWTDIYVLSRFTISWCGNYLPSVFVNVFFGFRFSLCKPCSYNNKDKKNINYLIQYSIS